MPSSDGLVYHSSLPWLPGNAPTRHTGRRRAGAVRSRQGAGSRAGRRGRQAHIIFGRLSGRRKLSDVTGVACREYARLRSTPAAARRELEDLRAAIIHHRREGLRDKIVSVVLPQKSLPRDYQGRGDGLCDQGVALSRKAEPSGNRPAHAQVHRACGCGRASH
jgi:hypothetical protein